MTEYQMLQHILMNALRISKFHKQYFKTKTILSCIFFIYCFIFFQSLLLFGWYLRCSLPSWPLCFGCETSICMNSFFSLWFVREGKIARGTVKMNLFPQIKLIGWSPLYNMQLWHRSAALLAEDVKCGLFLNVFLYEHLD